MKAIVTGGTGLLGSEFSNIDNRCNLIGSKDVDLTNKDQTMIFFGEAKREGVDTVIHCAAKVGGLGANISLPVDFFEQNMQINSSVLQSASENDLRVISVLSTCIYPDQKFVNYPLTEDQLHIGPPHNSNFGYAFAKRMLDIQTRAYRQQKNCKFISVIPNNMYGPNDNYDLNSGHVIPALIRKFYEAKLCGYDHVDIWGSGKPVREFTFARDAAKIILWLTENYDSEDPINIGNPGQISILDLTIMIAEEVGYKGDIKFDKNKPDGQHQKPSSNEKLLKLGWRGEYTHLRDGVRETIKSFSNRYPNVRGVII